MLNAVIITNLIKDPGGVGFSAVANYILSNGGSVLTKAEYKGAFDMPEGNIRYFENDALYKNADVAIVLGGDGTILETAQFAALTGCPILGINFGRMGYMAELEMSELKLIDELSSGSIPTEERMTLCVEIEQDGKRECVAEAALNDAVISHGEFPRVIDIRLCTDGRFVADYLADGLIIATPTGSTAYSMSAGGPILDPALSCLCVTPICPHSLTAKPLVFAADSELTVENIFEREKYIYLTVDGKKNYRLKQGAKVIVRKSELTVKLVNIKENTFFRVLREKMNGNI